MTLTGQILNGEIVFDHPIALPEGAAVQIEILPVRSPDASALKPRDDAPSLLQRLGDVVGSIDDLPVDGARNLGHYLYEAPKR